MISIDDVKVSRDFFPRLVNAYDSHVYHDWMNHNLHTKGSVTFDPILHLL